MSSRLDSVSCQFVRDPAGNVTLANAADQVADKRVSSRRVNFRELSIGVFGLVGVLRKCEEGHANTS